MLKQSGNLNFEKEVNQRVFFKSCMNEKIHETLNKINKLKTPVARSCHIGNNTSNNWGLLALTKNVQLIQYDHTSYGVDENCASWLVLENYGLISACYDHKGNLMPDETGKHLNLHLQMHSTNKYAQHMNYALFAKYKEQDLMQYHYDIANKLSQSINGRSVSFDTKEILSIAEQVRKIFKNFFELKKLDLLITRWIKKSKKNYVMMYKIGEIAYRANNIIEIYTTESAKVFSGTIDDLCDNFFSSIQSVHDRIRDGKLLERISYPWLDLKFSYLIAAIKEFFIDPEQKHFWHGGGSASQYYINDPQFVADMNVLSQQLINLGYLPRETNISLVPSFCCQLFATNKFSITVLEELFQIWIMYKKENPHLLNNAINLLSNISNPLHTIKETFKAVDVDILRKLKFLLFRFNELDANRLPIAHIVSYSHPSYNKYGIAQHNLLGKEILFPSEFYDLTWGEAELLTKILAEITIENYA